MFIIEALKATVNNYVEFTLILWMDIGLLQRRPTMHGEGALVVFSALGREFEFIRGYYTQ